MGNVLELMGRHFVGGRGRVLGLVEFVGLCDMIMAKKHQTDQADDGERTKHSQSLVHYVLINVKFQNLEPRT